MEAGFSSYAAGWAVGVEGHRPVRPLSARGLLAWAAELGYRRLQLADNCPMLELSAAQRAVLKDSAGQAGVQLELGLRGLTKENLSRYIKLAKSLEAPLLRAVIDGPRHEPDVTWVVRFLRRERSRLEEANVVLGIENHDRFPAQVLANIVAEADSPFVGICLDTANSWGCGEDIRTVVRALGPYTVNLHLKDIRVRRMEHAQGFLVEGTTLGDGNLPLEWLLAEIAGNGRCQSATLEHWVSPEPDLEATIRKEREWCLRSTATMRRLLPNSFTCAVS